MSASLAIGFSASSLPSPAVAGSECSSALQSRATLNTDRRRADSDHSSSEILDDIAEREHITDEAFRLSVQDIVQQFSSNLKSSTDKFERRMQGIWKIN